MMLSNLVLSTIALALSLAMAEPRREPETGSRLPRQLETELDREKVRKIQIRYGECVIAKNVEAARYFVLTPDPSEPERSKIFARIGDGSCLLDAANTSGAEMKFPVDTMRYVLAEVLVRNELPAGLPEQSIQSAAPLKQPTLDVSYYALEPGKKANKGELERLKQAREKRMALVFLAGFGECVVRADPLQSHSLLMTTPGSPDERKSFGILMPALSSCMSAGNSLSFDMSILRGTIAMNYYRLAHAPRVDAAAAGASK